MSELVKRSVIRWVFLGRGCMRCRAGAETVDRDPGPPAARCNVSVPSWTPAGRCCPACHDHQHKPPSCGGGDALDEHTRIAAGMTFPVGEPSGPVAYEYRAEPPGEGVDTYLGHRYEHPGPSPVAAVVPVLRPAHRG